VKIVAVNGSLVKGGNVSALLGHALSEYDGRSDVEVTGFELSSMRIEPCRHCNWCIKKQEQGRYCAQDDDMAGVYPVLVEADGIIIATPVHFGRLSGATADFIDRLRVFVHGKVTRGALRDMVGGALAVAWYRNAGIELALISITSAFHSLGILVATPDVGVWGGGAFSSIDGTGRTIKGRKVLVTEDEMGMASASSTAARVVELAALLKAGRISLDSE
jgi:multimeric flavodoxin WrbA